MAPEVGTAAAARRWADLGRPTTATTVSVRLLSRRSGRRARPGLSRGR
jgi:hypothetical protein